MPLKIQITDGTAADHTQTELLVEGIDAENLLADKAYDNRFVIDLCKKNQMNAIIPNKRNRVKPRNYDRYIYRYRHLVENAFLWLKRWRGIATRYAKNASSFLVSVQIRCLALWLNIS